MLTLSIPNKMTKFSWNTFTLFSRLYLINYHLYNMKLIWEFSFMWIPNSFISCFFISNRMSLGNLERHIHSIHKGVIYKQLVTEKVNVIKTYNWLLSWLIDWFINWLIEWLIGWVGGVLIVKKSSLPPLMKIIDRLINQSIN